VRHTLNVDLLEGLRFVKNKLIGFVLILIAVFKIVIALATLGNLLIVVQIATDLSILDLIVGTLVLVVGLYLIRK